MINKCVILYDIEINDLNVVKSFTYMEIASINGPNICNDSNMISEFIDEFFEYLENVSKTEIVYLISYDSAFGIMGNQLPL
jgi:hypothetical protein